MTAVIFLIIIGGTDKAVKYVHQRFNALKCQKKFRPEQIPAGMFYIFPSVFMNSPWENTSQNRRVSPVRSKAPL